MAESKKVTFRLADKVHAAATAKAEAAGQDISAWIRSLVERETGVKVDMPRGLAAVSKKRRKEISREGLRERWGDSAAE